MLPALASLAARRALAAATSASVVACGGGTSGGAQLLSTLPRAAKRALSTTAGPRANAGREDLSDIDRIHMRGMTFHGYHGVFAEVRRSTA